MTAIRSHVAPDANIQGVQVGDTVAVPRDQPRADWDVPHGFAAIGTTTDAEGAHHARPNSDAEVGARLPASIRSYCTCSALHQEMQGKTLFA
ncbi:MAG: hypothetical protein U0163_04070 [Gemmatimonadaceae bacterium]